MIAIPSADPPEEILRQAEMILTYDLTCNAIVHLELVHTNGETRRLLKVDGHETKLQRVDFELLFHLACAAHEDPRRRVLASELADHLQTTLPNGGADMVDSIYRRIYRLRQNCLGGALENSTDSENGYRFSTPNVFFTERTEDP